MGLDGILYLIVEDPSMVDVLWIVVDNALKQEDIAKVPPNPS